MQPADEEPTLPDSLHAQDVSATTWTRTLEEYVSNIGEEAQGFRILHLENAQSYSFYCSVQMYANCALAAASGLAGTLGMLLNPGPSILFPVISATIVFLLALTGPLFSQQKYDQLELTHRQAAAKFASLEGNVRRCMALPAQHRVPPGPYTSYIDSALKVNTESAPPLSAVSLARYNRIVSTRKNTKDMGLPLDPKKVKIHVEETSPLKWRGSSGALPMAELCAHADPEMQFELKRHEYWNRLKEDQPGS